MSDSILPEDPARRAALITTCAAGAVGSAAVVWPFLKSMRPSERALAAGAPVEVDITGMAPGEMKRVEWRGKPVWVVRRTPEMLEAVKKYDAKVADPASRRTAYPTPEYARNEYRSIKPEYLVVVGICTHLGCSPTDKFQVGPQPSLPDDWAGGFFCPCHGSIFDLAGRVFSNMPAPDNLEVPPHTYLSDSKILVGTDAEQVGKDTA